MNNLSLRQKRKQKPTRSSLYNVKSLSKYLPLACCDLVYELPTSPLTTQNHMHSKYVTHTYTHPYKSCSKTSTLHGEESTLISEEGASRRRNVTFLTIRLEQEAQLPQRNSASAAHAEGARPSSPLPLRPLWLHLCVWSNSKATTDVRQACVH